MKPKFKPNKFTYQNRSTSTNNGFWDRDADDRAARMEAACQRNDLPPEERARAYDD